MNKNYKDINQIAEECGCKVVTLTLFIKFAIRTNYVNDFPTPVPYAKSKYTYTKEDAAYIIKLFKEKPRGVMAEYNYEYNWGKKFREKYQRNK